MFAGRARALLETIDVASLGPRRVGRLAAFDGMMLEATGFIQPMGSSARIPDAEGHPVRAEVVGFRGDRALLMALDTDRSLVCGARVEPDGYGGGAEVGEALLGRVVAATRMLAFSSIPLAAIVAGGIEDALHNMYLVIVIAAALRFLVGLAASRTAMAAKQPSVQGAAAT